MLRRTLQASFFGARGVGGEADIRGYVRKGRGFSRTLGKIEEVGDIRDTATENKLNRATKLQKDFEVGGTAESRFYSNFQGYHDAVMNNAEKDRTKRGLDQAIGKGNEGLKKRLSEASTFRDLLDATKKAIAGAVGSKTDSGEASTDVASVTRGAAASARAAFDAMDRHPTTAAGRRLAKGKQLVHPRSVLFIPAGNQKALLKLPQLAKQSTADVFIIDLEDGVHPSQKEAARDNIYALLTGKAFTALAKPPRIIIRVNSPRTDPHWGLKDLEMAAVFVDEVEGIALPKVSELDAIAATDHIHPDHDIWAFFETARSIHLAHEICAQGCYSYAVMGTNDLAADLNIPTNLSEQLGDDPVAGPLARQLGRQALYYSIQRVVNAARMHGMGVLDGVFNDTGNLAGLKRETMEGRLLGLDGKTVIHPKHAAIVDDVYTPAQGEYLWARRVLDAANTVEGGGVATVDGKMVEWMHVQSAGNVVQRYEQAAEQKKEREVMEEEERREGKQQQKGEATSHSKNENVASRASSSETLSPIENTDPYNAEDDLLEKIRSEAEKKL